MQRRLRSVLVTGGAGFIGSSFVRYLLEAARFDGTVVNLDKLTYAGNIDNLAGLDEASGGKHLFVQGDICDAEVAREIMQRHDVDTIVHFAAESHVDRSIMGSAEFVRTNVVGTHVLLETARQLWAGRKDVVFHHVSTDEVFGSLGTDGRFSEASCYDPRSPYAASKAASDHLVRAYHHTYGLPILVSNCSNNYGPYQFPEKLVPLMICNMLDERPLPVYGTGANVRDWLYVEDHCKAIWEMIRRAPEGATYAIGGESERSNLQMIRALCAKVAAAVGKQPDHFERLITLVKDRPGHDLRYAMDCSAIGRDLGWRPRTTLDEGLDLTVRWYLENQRWVARVRSGEYKSWIAANYGDRERSR